MTRSTLSAFTAVALSLASCASEDGPPPTENVIPPGFVDASGEAGDSVAPSDTAPVGGEVFAAEDAPVADVGPVELVSCEGEEDCEDQPAFCVAVFSGKICAKPCIEDCPSGLSCVGVSLGGADLTYLCLPRGAKLCQPCSDHTDCQAQGDPGVGACLDYGEEGSFCGVACGPGAPCPTSYACLEIALADGSPTTQCRRIEGTCECNGLGKQLGMKTRCTRSNELGTCVGQRLCEGEGLTGCSASAPAIETCDGLDNDCNELVDDVPDNTPCTIDNELGGCPGKAVCVAGEPLCLPDPDLPDLDGDGVPDVCDPDADGDGFGTEEDCAPLDPTIHPGAEESCDGLDNDCNGQIDDDLCEDDNPCTTDACEPDTGACTHAPQPDGTACDADGSGCTGPDACLGGECAAGSPMLCPGSADGCVLGICVSTGAAAFECTQSPAPPGAACEDGDNCTAGDVCTGDGTCIAGGAVPGCCNKSVECDDSSPCTLDACDPELKQCTHKKLPDGIACDADGDGCTGGDECFAGTCAPGVPVACPPPPDPCALGVCTSTGPETYSCQPVPIPTGSACEDGKACTIGDACGADGLCAPGQGVPGCCENAEECDDGSDCTLDLCDPVAHFCSHSKLADGVPCDSGSFGCTVGDSCLGGGCAPGPVEIAGVPCFDDDACAAGDLCDGFGACIGGEDVIPDCCVSPADCNDGNPCTLDTCDPVTQECVNVLAADGTACPGDQSGCTAKDSCENGVCTVGPPAQCPPTGDACLAATCLSTGLDTFTCEVALAPGAPCDDGVPCTSGDTCDDAGVCSGIEVAGCCTTNAECEDGNPCTVGVCNLEAEQCTFPPGAPGVPCDADGDGCTVGDACQGGACAPGQAVQCPAGEGCLVNGCVSSGPSAYECLPTPGGACDDGDPCTDDICGEDGVCGAVDNSAPCDDGVACTHTDTCAGGQCAGETYGCDDGNPCTTGTCDGEGGCDQSNASGSCNDGKPCTTADSCVLGSCVGSPYQCFDGNPCTDDVCNGDGGCSYPGNSNGCSDGQACTHSDKCGGGFCQGTFYTCSDGNLCTNDVCNGSGGCSFPPNSSPCSDGKACTYPDTCSNGTCKGKSYSCDDKNACTQDSCNGAGGCFNSPLNCNDGNSSTLDSCDPKAGCQYCTVGGTQCVPGNGASCNSVLDSNEVWTGSECCVSNVIHCVEGNGASCNNVLDPAEHWTGDVCCVSCATLCVEGNGASCNNVLDPAEHWTGNVCCVNNVSQCVKGNGASCQGPKQHWTGKLCCVE